ncbi:hypothetical protein [Azospirillum melinis]
MVQPLLVDTSKGREMLGGMGKTQFFELLKQGKLKRIKIGTKTLVPISSIQEYVASLEAA